jgi:hypothetical protein
MFPTTGVEGWSVVPGPAAQPPVFPLPVADVAVYADPEDTGGLGVVLSSLSHHVGATTCPVRSLDGALEARFTQPNVYGVNLLDRIALGAPCTLVLTVYDDDGETELFQVGTDPDHPLPYLVEPDGYGEQEIDFAEGRASLTTVTVEVIDPAQIPGDQDSGWMTEQLARFGLANISGRRCRLVRFISEALGEHVIIDGPAGTPSMGSTYASYRWEIRDTRETERKIRLFEFAGSAAAGLRSLVPDELIDGYGYDGPTNTYLQRPGIPLEGHTHLNPFYPSPGSATIEVGASEFPAQAQRLRIWQEAYDAVINGIGRSGSTPIHNIEFLFRWRDAGSSDPWTEIPGNALLVSLSTAKSTTTEGARVVGQVIIEDRRVNPLDSMYDPDVADLPADDQIIEFFLLGPVPTNEKHPVVIDPRVVPGVDGPLNEGADLLLGQWQVSAVTGGDTTGFVGLTTVPGNAEGIRRQTVPVFNRLGNQSTVEDVFIPTRGILSWRAAGSADPWTDITLDPALGGPTLRASIELPLRNTVRVFYLLSLTAPTGSVPADLQDIEFTVAYPPGSPELLPVTVGMTAGEFAKAVYDGLYSPRDPDGLVVPLGVRYDEAALLLMTDLVRLRLTEPVDDAREFLEQMIYAPTGWVPALDRDGTVSPVSQIPPDDIAALPVIDNAITEPAPNWNAGQRIVNILRFTYPRDFVLPDDEPAYPDPAISSDPDDHRQKVVRAQPITMEFRDEASIDRHGEKVLELDGSAFTAIGVVPDAGEELTLPPQPTYRFTYGFSGRKLRIPTGLAPVTSTPIVRFGAYVRPVSGDVTQEQGHQLAELRNQHVLARYSLGAPAIDVNVMRAGIALLRAGSWVALDLSWLPDYVTQRRGLLGMGQIVAMGDLDCAWRRVLIEQVVPEQES